MLNKVMTKDSSRRAVLFIPLCSWLLVTETQLRKALKNRTLLAYRSKKTRRADCVQNAMMSSESCPCVSDPGLCFLFRETFPSLHQHDPSSSRRILYQLKHLRAAPSQHSQQNSWVLPETNLGRWPPVTRREGTCWLTVCLEGPFLPRNMQGLLLEEWERTLSHESSSGPSHPCLQRWAQLFL